MKFCRRGVDLIFYDFRYYFYLGGSGEICGGGGMEFGF